MNNKIQIRTKKTQDIHKTQQELHAVIRISTNNRGNRKIR